MSSDRRRHGSFEDRFVAFVDILGFRDIVSRMQKEHGLFSTVRDALKTSGHPQERKRKRKSACCGPSG